MTLLEALALGTMQGVTEFLPISSSGHLALAESWLPGVERPDLLFDVVVHLGTLLAIVWALRTRFVALARAGATLLPGSARSPGFQADRRWLGLIAVACVPTAILGVSLKGFVEAVRVRPVAVGSALLVTAAILVLASRLGRSSRAVREISVLDAVLVGIAQGLAVIPGISRSGATVGMALWRHARPEAAVEFSLLVSVPAILGANLMVWLGTPHGESAIEAGPLLFGFISAFAVGVLSLQALRWLVAQNRFLPFAGYCTALGLGAITVG